MAESEGDISLDEIVLRRLKELLKPLDPKQRILRFPKVFGRICPLLCLKKDEAWRVLHRLETKKLIEVVPFQGIRFVQSAEQPAPPDASENETRQRILAYLKERKQAYPSDIAEALELDIDTVLHVSKKLMQEGKIA